jgi:hypothetical protein
VKSPQNPTLDVLGGEQPNVAASRGFENLAINPSRTRLYPMFEGPVGADDPQDLRILEFDLATHRFTHSQRRLRLEMPGATVNLQALNIVGPGGGTVPAYPGAPPRRSAGGESAAELTSVNGHQLLVVERDSNGDGVDPPRFKKVFLLDTEERHSQHRYVDKDLLIDLMAVPDPAKLGIDGADADSLVDDFFQFPFNTIESVHIVSPDTVLTANDNNYPFSNARSRSLTNARTGPLAPDENEFILVRLGQRLHVDSRLLAP